MARKRTRHYLLCISNEGYPASLEIRKVYQVIPDDTAAARHFVRIIDESGEDYLYPEECFVHIELPNAALAAFGKAS